MSLEDQSKLVKTRNMVQGRKVTQSSPWTPGVSPKRHQTVCGREALELLIHVFPFVLFCVVGVFFCLGGK